MSFVLKLQAPFERLIASNLCPYKALKKAIILQAIIDASNTSFNKRAKKLELEARKWLFSDSQSFLDICDDAELEVEYVRKVAYDMIYLNHTKQNKKNLCHNMDKNNLSNSLLKTTEIAV